MSALQKWTLYFLATVFTVAISYQWLDRPIALFFHKAIARPNTLAPLSRLPDPFIPLAVVAFVGLGLWTLSGRPLSHIQKCILLGSISLMSAEIIKGQLKLVFGRTWPDTWTHNNPSYLRDGVYGFNFFHDGSAYASFPSGHMAVTCAMISVLWVFYPTLRTVYTFVALAMAIALTGANYHFLSDVIAGAFVGISSGWIVMSLWKAHEHVFDIDDK